MYSDELKGWIRDHYPSYLQPPDGGGRSTRQRTGVSRATSTYSHCTKEGCALCKRGVQVNGDVATMNCKQNAPSSLVTVVIARSLTAAGASLEITPSPDEVSVTT